VTLALGAAALIAWIYLLLGRGMFWLTRERDDRRPQPAEPAVWPSVAAIVPARNEADVIGRSIGSLVAQDYPGDFRIVLMDDGSTDGTAAAAPPSERLEIRAGAPLATGWTGKLWAVAQGVDHVSTSEMPPDYLLLTDADIAHAPDNLRALVARAEASALVLTSLMAKLAVESPADRMMIPAFVFFFDMLFPFAWVNDPRRETAAAAGGCMLVRRDALERAGGIAAIRREIIDDCALGALMKRQGPIWLGLTERARSLRPYGDMGEIGRMISRSAYAQLKFSPWRLAGTLLGLVVVYLAAPLLAVFGEGSARLLGALTWLSVAVAFQPMLRFYRRSPLWGLALPAIAGVYAAFTLKSAIDVWRGRGGLWKGRAQAITGTTA
jgi:hopene-associated glycosyltransferase HpnB